MRYIERMRFETKADIFSKANQLGIMWARIYIFWYFPLGIVLSSVTAVLMPITDLVAAPENYNIPVSILILILRTLFIFLMGVTYVNMKRLKFRAYYFNVAYLVLAPLFVTTGYAIIFWYIVFILPNIIYFKKRETLFTE